MFVILGGFENKSTLIVHVIYIPIPFSISKIRSLMAQHIIDIRKFNPQSVIYVQIPDNWYISNSVANNEYTAY